MSPQYATPEDMSEFWNNFGVNMRKAMEETVAQIKAVLSSLPSNPRAEQYDRLVEEARELFLTRNAEYGDAFEADGLLGVLFEFTAIAARLRQMRTDVGKMVYRDVAELDQEAISQLWSRLHDKLQDSLNYSVMGLMLLEELNFAGSDQDPLLADQSGLKENVPND